MTLKNINRIIFISSNAARQTFVSVVGILIPFMVIEHATKEIWGEFVSILLYSLLATQIINWGNKEYVLRKFSENPSEIKECFSSFLVTRFPLVLFFSIIAFFLFKIEFGLYLFFWIFGRFLIHSYEALILFEKKFYASLAIELGCFILFIVVFYSFSVINTVRLVQAYSLLQLSKGMCYWLLFYTKFSLKTKLNFNYYKDSFWFFLLSILGFLASKIDVYIVEQFDDKLMTSDYQIINGLLVFIMSISAFIYSPFTKNIYRFTEITIQKTKKKLALFGILIVPISLLILHIILYYFLHVSLSFWFYVVAFFYAFPSFVYGIEILYLFKQNKEKMVVYYSLIIVLVNFIITYFFLLFNYGIIGALLGAAISQLVALFLFNLKKYKNDI